MTHVHGILAWTVSAPRVCFDNTSSWPLFPVNPMIHNYFFCVLTFYRWDNVSLPCQNPCLFTISEAVALISNYTMMSLKWSDQIDCCCSSVIKELIYVADCVQLECPRHIKIDTCLLQSHTSYCIVLKMWQERVCCLISSFSDDRECRVLPKHNMTSEEKVRSYIDGFGMVKTSKVTLDTTKCLYLKLEFTFLWFFLFRAKMIWTFPL